VHPGHSVEEVLDQTGFAFDRPDRVPATAPPSPEILSLLRGKVAREIAPIYPSFAARLEGKAE